MFKERLEHHGGPMVMHRSARLAALTLVVTLAACQDTPTQPVDRDVGPAFSEVGDDSGRDFGEFEPLANSAACVAPPATLAGFESYEPFVLPPGFHQRIAADELGDFRPVAGTGADVPDMNTLNESGPFAGRFLYRTHETGSNGAVTVLDLATGVVSLVDQAPHYEALDGIAWTPWNTLIFAEERIVASLKDPRAPNAVGGLVYEWDPRTGGSSTPRPAVGARSHEGLRFDNQGNLYGISESGPTSTTSGGIYKFVPDHLGDLSSGQLFALKVLDATSRTGEAVWVPLDRSLVQINSDLAAVQAGATGWGRPEDMEIVNLATGGEVMFVAATSEDLVLRIELHGDKATVSNYVLEGVNVSGLNNPDNLAVDRTGSLYILEDTGPSDIWVVPNVGKEAVAANVLRFMSLSDCSAESTGLYFDQNSKTAWVHIQHAGGALRNDLLVEVTRPKQ
jgi:uncharacterized protein